MIGEAVRTKLVWGEYLSSDDPPAVAEVKPIYWKVELGIIQLLLPWLLLLVVGTLLGTLLVRQHRQNYRRSTTRLFKEGLPRMDWSGLRHSSKSKASRRNMDQAAGQLTLHQKDFLSLKKDFKKYAPTDSFILIDAAKNNGKLIFTSEAEVQGHVKAVLNDMLTASGLDKKLTLGLERSLKLLLRPDILVLEAPGQLQYTYPICCIEVKKPGINFEDTEILGQLRDYMLQLRTMFGLIDVFGILTTYEYWQIVWLPDCQDLAESDKVFGGKNKPFADPKAIEENSLANVAVLHGTDAIRYSDLRLPAMLVSLFHKVAGVRWIERPLINEKGQLHPCISSSQGFYWSTVSLREVKLKLHSTSATFILLCDFRFGADGCVWMTCTESGFLAMIKFRFGLNTMKLCKEESSLWYSIFDVPARHVEFPPERHAILMPFAFTCQEDPVTNNRSFQPLLRVRGTQRDDHPTTSPEGVRVEKGDEKYLKEKNVASLLSQLDPEEIAREAIDRMVARGYVHWDVHWRHVAALPVWKKGATEVVGFRGVFIDLSDVPPLEVMGLTADQARTKMLRELGLH